MSNYWPSVLCLLINLYSWTFQFSVLLLPGLVVCDYSLKIYIILNSQFGMPTGKFYDAQGMSD